MIFPINYFLQSIVTSITPSVPDTPQLATFLAIPSTYETLGHTVQSSPTSSTSPNLSPQTIRLSLFHLKIFYFVGFLIVPSERSLVASMSVLFLA